MNFDGMQANCDFASNHTLPDVIILNSGVWKPRERSRFYALEKLVVLVPKKKEPARIATDGRVTEKVITNLT